MFWNGVQVFENVMLEKGNDDRLKMRVEGNEAAKAMTKTEYLAKLLRLNNLLFIFYFSY